MKNPYSQDDTVPEDGGIPDGGRGTRVVGAAVWLTVVVLGTLLVAYWGGIPAVGQPTTHAPTGDAAATDGVVELTMDFGGKTLGVRAHPGDRWVQIVLFDSRIGVFGDPPA